MGVTMTFVASLILFAALLAVVGSGVGIITALVRWNDEKPGARQIMIPSTAVLVFSCAILNVMAVHWGQW